MVMSNKEMAEAFNKAADIVKEERHKAELAAARSARDSQWDDETYYRAKAEGLAKAEQLLRGHAEELA